MNRQDQPFSCQPQRLLLYHYAELDAVEQGQVEQHLQCCFDCRVELAALQELLSVVPEVVPELMPVELDRFTARVMKQVKPRRPWFVRPGLGWALAGGAALLLVMNLDIVPQTSSPVSTQPPLAITADPDVLSNLEFLQTLELLEDFELIQQLGELG